MLQLHSAIQREKAFRQAIRPGLPSASGCQISAFQIPLASTSTIKLEGNQWSFFIALRSGDLPAGRSSVSCAMDSINFLLMTLMSTLFLMTIKKRCGNLPKIKISPSRFCRILTLLSSGNSASLTNRFQKTMGCYTEFRIRAPM